MKKIVLVLFFSLFCSSSYSQTFDLRFKLYYTCKVWGFAKYYHSNVNNCSVNWDSVLVSVLPAIRAASTDSVFNDVLDTMLAAAGPMSLSTTYFPDTLPTNLKFNRDFSWMSASIFRSDVLNTLDTIKNNFRPHSGCYAEYNTYTTPYLGYLVLPHDSIEVDINTYVSFPDEDHRLLMLFKYWNVVRFFYPYTYLTDIPWDTTLSNYVTKIDSVGDSYSLYLLYLKIATNLNDAHVFLETFSTEYEMLPGYEQPPIRLKYVENKYIVVESLVPGIIPGDVLISIDGRTVAQWEDSLIQYYSASNMTNFRRIMCQNMLGRIYNGMTEGIITQDSTGINHTFFPTCIAPSSNSAFYYNFHYPCDSLDSIKWTTLPCDIGYVNMGNLQTSDENVMYNDLQNKTAIIFDLRNYPNQTAWGIANLMYPNEITNVKFSIPDITYPGTFYSIYQYSGYNGNPTPYTGKVIILMDEVTQSQAEFSCMILGAMPGSIKVGSQTAGADGNISYWGISQDLRAGFTTLGTFYPNGDSTQRIGIVPDSVVKPTISSIRNKKDLVLEKALSIAGCNLNVPKLNTYIKTELNIYPNPAYNELNIGTSNFIGDKIIFQLSDITGRILSEKTLDNCLGKIDTKFDITNFSSGIYFVNVISDNQKITSKFVKQ